jgi:hypothetical protein
MYINDTIEKHSTNNTKTQYKQYKNAVQTIQSTLNTSTHITKTPTHYKITHSHTHTLQNKLKQLFRSTDGSTTVDHKMEETDVRVERTSSDSVFGY